MTRRATQLGRPWPTTLGLAALGASSSLTGPPRPYPTTFTCRCGATFDAATQGRRGLCDDCAAVRHPGGVVE